ncbi:hypothetical protein LCGC14_2038190, partial [marine sediment metagenome]
LVAMAVAGLAAAAPLSHASATSKPAAETRASAPPKPAVETRYAAVFMDGKKIGHAKHVRSVASGKVTTSEFVTMSISRMGTPMTIKLTESCVETVEGKPVSFKGVQDLGIIAQRLDGTIDAAGKLTIAIGVGGAVQTRTMPWPKGALLPEGARKLSLAKGLAEGTKYSFMMFSPILSKGVKVDVAVGPMKEVDLLGRVVKLTEVKALMHGPSGAMPTVNYVDSGHHTLKSATAMMGMELEIIDCPKAFALSPNDTLDFFSRVMLSSPTPLKDVRKASSVTYHLQPTGKAKLNFPTTDNQQVRQGGGQFIVTVRPAAAAKGVARPYKGKDPAALAALKPTRFLQSDDKKVVELTRQAVGKTTDAAEAARRIEAFVAKHIKQKDLSVGYASAAEVAQSGRGDCTEHALLTAAMCRAAGIPARVATGLVYVERFADKTDLFGPHAWTEALIGDKWIGLDAAFKGYSPGHITLLVGDGELDEFFGIISTMGNFKIAKVEVTR